MVPAPSHHDDGPSSAPSEQAEALADHLRPLLPLLGRWRTTGTVFDRQGDEAARIRGQDSWAPLPGGRWITHQSATRVGDRLVHVHQVIGGEHPDGGWQMLAFEEGSMPELTRLSDAGDGVMQVLGPGTRATFQLPTRSHDPLLAHWERLVDGYWLPWLRVRYERV
ncbi:hypothetical protein [Nocardioides aequoreus]|uniref:hypothetical protein n=1 Tax=Nocardioides aequoreus TaxID=397278 RepID=UPI0004C45AC1|nr:hypothetical protein [Nocardioides aequoreus]